MRPALVEDTESRVRLMKTILEDIRGIWRLRRQRREALSQPPRSQTIAKEKPSKKHWIAHRSGR